MKRHISHHYGKTSLVLIHFGELILKGKNRKWFMEKLLNNIRANLRQFDIKRIENLSGRIVVEFYDAHPVKSLSDRLSKVFGVASFAPAFSATPDIADIERTVISCLDGREIGSYAVRAKRICKKHPYTSQEVNERVGGAIWEKLSGKVDLDDPDTMIKIDILADRSYVYVDRFPGAGGLPVGTGGRVACLISGGIDSPVASWRMMRRGCIPCFIHFHSAPFTDRASIEKVKEMVGVLSEWAGVPVKLAMVPLGEIQKKIVTKTPERYRVILYRRFMVRIACALAGAMKAEALVTGEALGQVASQTLSNMATVEKVSSLPILRPLIGMDKQEITDQAIRIGTYGLSIIPHKDCCQFLEPRHPVTHSTHDEILAVESVFDVEGLVKEGLTAAEWADIRG